MWLTIRRVTMCDFQEVIEKDVKTTLKESFNYGERSLEQFWKLNGETICDTVYEALTREVREQEEIYTKLIGSKL